MKFHGNVFVGANTSRLVVANLLVMNWVPTVSIYTAKAC